MVQLCLGTLFEGKCSFRPLIPYFLEIGRILVLESVMVIFLPTLKYGDMVCPYLIILAFIWGRLCPYVPNDMNTPLKKFS